MIENILPENQFPVYSSGGNIANIQDLNQAAASEVGSSFPVTERDCKGLAKKCTQGGRCFDSLTSCDR